MPTNPITTRVVIYPQAVHATQHLPGARVELGRQGDRVARLAQSTAPVRTGRLRGKIRVVSWRGGVRVGTDVDYAGYVERGTRKMRGRHYMRRALQAAER